jgi:hypothetical protein
MSADINDRIALAIGEQAPELARAWARQMIDDLHLKRPMEKLWSRPVFPCVGSTRP